MKVHFLPERQEARNDQIIRRLRRVTITAWLLLIACVATGATLYVRGPIAPIEPLLVAADTGTVIGDAVVISPEFAVSVGDGAAQAELIAGGRRVMVRRIRTEPIANVPFTLYRLESQSPVEPLTPTVADGSETLVAQSGGVLWRGVITKSEPSELAVEPELTVQQGVPVYLENDRTAVVGITTQVTNRITIVPIAVVLDAFPEIAGAR